jgi:histidinol phosphatase-like enzyme
MRSGFESFNPIPKQGITPADIAAQMTGLQYPDVVIFDMDKTIKEPHDGRSFPKTPDDFQLTTYFHHWIRDAVVDFDCYVVSNQRGIETGQKTVQFLKDEAELLNDLLISESIDCPIKRYYFAPSKKENITIDLIPDEDGDMRWVQTHYLDKADKPRTEMFRHIYETNPAKIYWIVGDSHTDNTATDWQFAQNCQKQFPQLDIRYVPIEMLNVFWSLV